MRSRIFTAKLGLHSKRAAVGVSVLLVAAACKTGAGTPGPAVTGVAGIVTDSTGAALSGVTVTAGSAKATTSSGGAFTFALPPTSKLVLSFTKTGYLPSSKQVTITADTTSNVVAALMAAAPAAPLDATKGGMVKGTRGSSLKADPGVFVDSTGKAVSGSVDVSLTPLSPAVPGELAAYPGTLAGTKSGAAPKLLHTYGVLDVTVSQNGQPVQVASGHAVTVEIPVAGTGPMASTQDLWTYDMTTGIWDYEGTAKLDGSTYTAQLSHFSYHNIDEQVVEGQATCVTGLVVDSSGNPVSGASVSPEQGASVDLLISTDSNGRYCTWISTGQSETITANGTAAPYGEGSISVTGGSTGIPYPGTESCAGLDCVTAPNIVLNQAPCKTDSDCPSADTCCAADGTNMCLTSFACELAMTSGAASCTKDTDCPTGDVCCDVTRASKMSCLSQMQCDLANSGAGSCGSGALSATVAGATQTWSCFVAELENTTGSQALVFDASSGMGSTENLLVTFTTKNDFAEYSAGGSVTLGGADALVTLTVTGKTASGGTLEATATAGTLTLNKWSTTTGNPISITLDGVKLSGEVISGSTPTTVTGTATGTASSSLLVVP